MLDREADRLTARGQGVRRVSANKQHRTRTRVPVPGLKRTARFNRTDVDAWFALLAALNAEPFMPDGREQPPLPSSSVDFDA